MTTGSSGSCLALAARVIRCRTPHSGAEGSPTVVRSAADALRRHDGPLQGRRGGTWHRLANGPEEAGQLPGNGRAYLDLQLVPVLEQLVTSTQAFLRDPGDVLNGLR